MTAHRLSILSLKLLFPALLLMLELGLPLPVCDTLQTLSPEWQVFLAQLQKTEQYLHSSLDVWGYIVVPPG